MAYHEVIPIGPVPVNIFEDVFDLHFRSTSTVIITNGQGTAPNAYFGGPNVSATSFGVKLAAGERFQCTLEKGEPLYAMSNSPHNLFVLYVNV